MIERTYRCNLCREAHEPTSGNLYALHWDSRGLAIMRLPFHSGDHICRKCFADICNSKPLLDADETTAAPAA